MGFKRTSKAKTESQSFKRSAKPIYDSTEVKLWEIDNKQALNTLNSYNERIGKLEWMSEDDRNTYRGALDTYIDTTNKLRGVNKAYGKGYTAEEDKAWADIVNSMNTGYADLIDHYSQFNSADAYNLYYADAKNNSEEATQKYQYYLDYDLEEAKDNLGRYEYWLTIPNQISDLNNQIKQWEYAMLKGGDIWGEYAKKIENAKSKISALEFSLGEIDRQYGSYDDLKALYSKTHVDYTNAERIQLGHKLGTVSDSSSEYYDPNFLSYSEKGGNISWQNVGKSKWDTDGGYTDPDSGYLPSTEYDIYDDLKAAALVMNEKLSGNEIYNAKMGESDVGRQYNGDNSVKINLYRKMSKAQAQTLAYYLAKDAEDGTNLAQSYVDAIYDEIAAKRGAEIAAEQDTLIEKYLFAFDQGLSSFFSGIGNIFAGEEDIKVGVNEYASDYVDKSLANVGIPMWYNFAEGKWEDTIAGRSTGQMFYDAINSMGNMMPSILISFIPYVGTALGAISMGASAAGNAKLEMLRLGYPEAQATSYGLMVGASEGALQYFLGGISKLGGKVSGGAINKLVGKIDNAFARVAVSAGGSMISEGLEEAIQTALEPFFKSLATGEDFEGAGWDEILYSALLGAVTAGVMEGGPSVVGTTVNSIKTGKKYGSQAPSIVSNALQINPENTHAQRMQSRLDNGKKVSGYQINRLMSDSYDSVKSQAKARFTELGESKINADKLSTAVAKATMGMKLTSSDLNSMKNSKHTETVLLDFLGKTGMKEESNTPKVETTTEGEKTHSASVRTDIQSVNIDGDNVTFTLDNGETVSQKDMKFFSNEQKAVVDTALNEVAASKFTSEAASAMIKNYDGSMPATDYYNVFKYAYELGQNNQPTSQLNKVMNLGLSERVAFIAYEVGKSSKQSLQSDSNSAIIKEKGVNKDEGTDGIRVRNGGKRDGGKNTDRQVSRVEGNAGQDKKGRESRNSADSEAARLVNEGRKVKVADLGILGGSTEQTVTVVDKANETAEMKKARKLAEERGLKVTFFVGDNLVINEKGKWIAANGYIKGENVFVRADHSRFTSEQIMRHEVGHDKVAKGEVDIDAIRERLKELTDEESVEAIAEYYTEAYAGSNLTEKQIWEECICDALADMNIFAGSANTIAASVMQEMIPGIQSAAESVTKSPTQTRGSPNTDTKIVSTVSKNSEKISKSTPKKKTNKVAQSEKQIASETKKVISILKKANHKVVGTLNGQRVISDGFIVVAVSDEVLSRVEKEIGELTEFDFERLGMGEALNKTEAITEIPTEYAFVNNNKSVIEIKTETQEGYFNKKIASKLDGKSFSLGKYKNGFSYLIATESDGTLYGLLLPMRMTPESKNKLTNPTPTTLKSFAEKTTTTTEGKASRDMSDEDYNNFGWVRANNVLNAGYWRNFTENFAQAVTENQYFPKSKSGEYMISVYDFYSESEVSDVVVFAKGTIESPNITKIVKFNLDNEADIYPKRRNLYEAERRGIRQKTGEIFDIYYKAHFVSGLRKQGNSVESVGNNNRLNTKRSRSEIKANPITQFNVNEEENTVTYTYRNGETITESISSPEEAKESGEASREMDAEYLSAVNRGDMETAQAMVDEAAKEAGYDSPKLYHGTRRGGFTIFDENKNDLAQHGFFFTTSLDVAKSYFKGGDGTIYTEYARMKKPLVVEGHRREWNNLKFDIGNDAKEYQTRQRSDGFWEIHTIEGRVNIENQTAWSTKEEAIQAYKNAPYVHPTKSVLNTTRDIVRYAYNKGEFDGVIIKDTIDMGDIKAKRKISTLYIPFNPEQIKSADPVTYDDDGNVIPLSERFNSENNDIRYSREIDSLGNELSEEQAEYFKDSKVRDENGNLLVVYHGTRKADFTVFKRNINFFTDSETMADSYAYNGEKYEGYLNITNPYVIDADGARWSRIPIDKSTKAFLDNSGASTFKEDGKWRTTPADIASAIEEAIDEGEVDYDGIIIKNVDDTGSYSKDGKHIVANDYIAFSSSQFKKVDNKTPTSNPDIRYSRELDTIEYTENKTEEVKAPSNRELLINALEGVAKNEAERKKLADYKSNLDNLDRESKKLAKLKKEIKELTFGKGEKNSERLKALRDEAKKTENRINIYDKRLLGLEATSDLKKVLEREKKRAFNSAREQGREALKQQRRMSNEEIARVREQGREQLRKNIEGKHKSEARAKIKRLKEKLQNTMLHPTERSYIPTGLVNAIVEVCGLIDDSTSLYHKDGSINKAQQTRNEINQKLQDLVNEYEKIKKDPDAAVKEEYDEEIHNYLADIREKYATKNISDMTLDELTELYQMLRAIDETLRDARMLIGVEGAESIYEVGDSIISEQDDIRSKRKHQKKFGWVESLSLSPMRAVLEMSGYNEDSMLYDQMREIEFGEREKLKFVMNATKSFEELTTGDNLRNYEDAMYKPYGEPYTDTKGKKFFVSKMQMMQAIMSYDRELANSELKHVSKGGFAFANLKLLRKGKIGEAITADNSHTITLGADIAEDFRRKLSGDAWAQAYMTAANKFFNEMAKDAINDATMLLKHRIVATGKNYIPYEVDQTFVAKEITSENDIQKTINSYGMLKDLAQNATQPLIITGLNNVLDRHIEEVGNIHGLAVPIRNFNKVWNVKSIDGTTTVKGVIEKTWSKNGTDLITQAIRDIQGSRPKNSKLDHIEEAYYKTKANYIKAIFTLNLSVVSKQIGSLFSATSMLNYRDPASMLANLAYTMAHFSDIAAEVDKYTASSWIRRQGLSDSELATLKTMGKKGIISRAVGKIPLVKKIDPKKWVGMMDSAVALSLWKYAKEDVAKRTGLEGEDLMRATAVFYDDVVSRTQSMADVLHRPEIQKGNGPKNELFGTFKTDLFQGAGQLKVALGTYAANKNKENLRSVVKAFVSILSNIAWGALMNSLWAIIRYKVNPYREDDDEITWENWLKVLGMNAATELISYFFPLFGGESAGAIQRLISGEDIDELNSFALGAFNNVVDALTTAAKYISEGEIPEGKVIMNLLNKVLTLCGVPAENISRFVTAIKLHAEDIANDEFLSFEAGVDGPNSLRLYNAYIENDEAKKERASRYYEDEKAINTALRKAIREYDPRVKTEVMARLSKDFTTANSIRKEVTDEGHFAKGIVKDAFTAEYNYVLEKINEAKAYIENGKPDKAEEIYKALDKRGYDIDQLKKI